MLQAFLTRVDDFLPLKYLALDGHFGNNNALQMTRQWGLELISKLRSDAVLYFPYEGEYAGRGPRRKYGDRLDPDAIPARYLKHVSIEKGVETRIYQATLRHKEFAQPLNVVILLKTYLATGRKAHVLLFSSNLELSHETLIDYYSLRFQLEFNFRDAKQFWGLEDFMNIKPIAVTNAANLSLFMVNLSARLRHDLGQAGGSSQEESSSQEQDFSVLDLKAHYRGLKYVEEVIKLLPQIPDPIVLEKLRQHLVSIGSIHPKQNHTENRHQQPKQDLKEAA